MASNWFDEKRAEFMRDLLRDYCLAVQVLERLFRDFDRTGAMAFEALSRGAAFALGDAREAGAVAGHRDGPADLGARDW